MHFPQCWSVICVPPPPAGVGVGSSLWCLFRAAADVDVDEALISLAGRFARWLMVWISLQVPVVVGRGDGGQEATRTFRGAFAMVTMLAIVDDRAITPRRGATFEETRNDTNLSFVVRYV